MKINYYQYAKIIFLILFILLILLNISFIFKLSYNDGELNKQPKTTTTSLSEPQQEEKEEPINNNNNKQNNNNIPKVIINNNNNNNQNNKIISETRKKKEKIKKVFPLAYLDVIPIEENSEIPRMRGVCKVYLNSYFSFNLPKNNSIVYPILIGAENPNKPNALPYSHWKKVENVYKFLASPASNIIDDEDYVIFSDATDVSYVNDINNFITIYEEYFLKELSNIDPIKDKEKEWPIILQAELNQWPPNDYLLSQYKRTDKETELLEKYYFNERKDFNSYPIHKNCNREKKRIYLNSGFYAGRKRDVRNLLKIANFDLNFNEPKPRIEDQGLFNFLYITKKYPIIVDCEFKLVYSPFIVCANLKIDDKSEWGCKIDELRGFEKEIDKNGNRPIGIHSNAGICPTLCSCLQRIKNMGLLKKNINKYNNHYIYSYNVDEDKLLKYPFLPVCGKFMDVDYTTMRCNAY